MKIRNKCFQVMLSFLMTVTLLPALTKTVKAANDNLALNQPTKASSTFPNKPWSADKAVDGDKTGDSRWSSKRATGTTNDDSTDKGTLEQWWQVDLGKETSVEQINLTWESAFATKYKIQTSLTGESFDTAKECSATQAGEHTYRNLGIANTRYIRILCTTPKTANYGYSIYEAEVFAQNKMDSSKDALQALGTKAPTIAADGHSLKLPEIADGYKLSLFGSDNQQVVKLDGTIISPLVDTSVNLLYKVENEKDTTDVANAEENVTVTIPGLYQVNASDNAKPNVVPGLREWKGTNGSYQRTANTRIVVADSSMSQAATTIKSYFDEILGIDIQVVNGTAPVAGDIYLETGGSTNELGVEGYTLTINDMVTITSPTLTGMTYGGASISQMLYQDAERTSIPKGLARDYPKYEVRAGMIDVGRMYIPLNYLKEMTIYMSWYKMNEAHIHINDYWSGSGYSAFRLQSEVYPQIVATDGYYTKDEYRQYQKDVKQYGIDVITEIDTPYHAECFKNVPGVKMLKTGYLDITTDSARAANETIIENLFDEYLDGDDPVIQSDKFHIGTDEYDKAYGEQMRDWTDHFINYVNNKGYESRVWGSLGKNGFNGTTPVSNQATLNLWAPYWADVHEMYNNGYDIINTYGGWLYIVPGANAGYPDRLDMKRLYNEFEVPNFKSGRNPSGEAIMPYGHPQTKGAEFCLWNDMTSYKTGFSWFDVFDRFKDGVSMVSEKTWYGEKQAGQTYDQFVERVAALGDKVPNINPSRYVKSNDKEVATYKFTQDGKDSSSNKYDATLTKATIKDGVATFNKDGYATLPFNSIGYPATVSMKVNLTDIDEHTTLFSGEDGVVYANIDNSGKIGFKRGAYRFSFDYELPEDEWVTLTFVADSKNTTLYVNGISKGKAKSMDATIGGKAQESGTNIFTFEKIMDAAKGSIDDLKIYNYAMDQTEIEELMNIAKRDNYALKKGVSASSLEVSDGRFTADKAVDGIVSSDSRVSFGKATDEQWLLLDLGEVKTVSDIVINYESQVPEYKIQVSEDSVTYTDVYNFKDDTLASGTKGNPGVQSFSIQPTKARYVKYVQLKRWKNTGNSNYYSGSIYELEVYTSPNLELKAYADTALSELLKYTAGTHNGNVDKTFYDTCKKELTKYIDLSKDPVSISDLLLYKQSIFDMQDELPSMIQMNKQDALDAYNTASKLVKRNYTRESFTKFTEAFALVSMDDLDTVEAIDQAIKDIKAASGLLVKVDNATLVTILKEANAIDLTEYEAQYQDQFRLAVKKAKEVLASPVSQNEINTAIKDVRTAIDALVKKPAPVDKKSLQTLLNKYQQLNSSDYTNTSWAIFQKAFAQAKSVNKDTTATQSTVDNASKALKTAADKLEKKPVVTVDKKVLNMLLNQYKDFNKKEYTSASWTVYQEAYDQAKLINQDKKATQTEVNNACTALKEATTQLVKKPAKVNKTPLYEVLLKYSGYHSNDYTSDSWKVFMSAYTEAKAVYDDKASTQHELDAAKAKLEKAATQLKKASTASKPSNKDKDEEITKVPDTSDTTSLNTLLFTMMISAGAVFFFYKRKKRSEQ